METHHNHDMKNQDESHEVNDLAGSELENSTQNLGGDTEDVNQSRSHSNHEHHGNRKYESHSNHSSASDQTGTTTDTNLGRDNDR